MTTGQGVGSLMGGLIGSLIAPGLGTMIGGALGGMIGGILDPPRPPKPKASDVQNNSFIRDLPVPLVIGQDKIAGGIIHIGKTWATTENEGSKKAPQYAVVYHANFAIAIGYGPIKAFLNTYVNDNLISSYYIQDTQNLLDQRVYLSFNQHYGTNSETIESDIQSFYQKRYPSRFNGNSCSGNSLTKINADFSSIPLEYLTGGTGKIQLVTTIYSYVLKEDGTVDFDVYGNPKIKRDSDNNPITISPASDVYFDYTFTNLFDDDQNPILVLDGDNNPVMRTIWSDSFTVIQQQADNITLGQPLSSIPIEGASFYVDALLEAITQFGPAIPWRNTAYIYCNGSIGYSNSLPTVAVEIAGLCCESGENEANPINFLYQYFTNKIWGMGYPASLIDGVPSVNGSGTFNTEYLYSNVQVPTGISNFTEPRFRFSKTYASKIKGLDLIREVLQSCRGFLYYSQGKLCVKIEKENEPVGFYFADGLQANFISGANSTVSRIYADFSAYPDGFFEGGVGLITIDQDYDFQILNQTLTYIDLVDYLPITPNNSTFTVKKDNINKGSFSYKQQSQSEVNNKIRVNYINRNDGYRSDYVEIDNTYDINYGNQEVHEMTYQLEGVKRKSQADRLATFYSDFNNYVKFYCEFTTDIIGFRCDVGEIVGVYHSTIDWGIKKFRVASIEEVDNFDVKVCLIEYVSEIYHDNRSTSPIDDTIIIPSLYTPLGQVNKLKLIEDITSNKIWITFSKPISNNQYWQGAQIYYSWDGGTTWKFSQLIQNDIPSVRITEDITYNDSIIKFNPDTLTGTFLDSGVIWLDGEQIYYGNINDVDSQFEECIRGFNNTLSSTHLSGNLAIYLSKASEYIEYTQDQIGETLTVKAVSVSTAGISSDVDEAPTYSITIKNLAGLGVFGGEIGKNIVWGLNGNVVEDVELLNPNGQFLETFETYTKFTLIDGNAIDEYANDGFSGTRAFKITNGGTYRWGANVPFDSTRLYRMRIRFKCNQLSSVSERNKFYCGVMAYSDEVTVVDALGGNTWVNSYWIVCNNLDLNVLTLDQWYEYTGYFQGYGDFISNANDPTIPSGLYSDINKKAVYYRPVFRVNTGDDTISWIEGDGIVEVDYIMIDIIQNSDDIINGLELGSIITDKLADNAISNLGTAYGSITFSPGSGEQPIINMDVQFDVGSKALVIVKGNINPNTGSYYNLFRKPTGSSFPFIGLGITVTGVQNATASFMDNTLFNEQLAFAYANIYSYQYHIVMGYPFAGLNAQGFSFQVISETNLSSIQLMCSYYGAQNAYPGDGLYLEVYSGSINGTLLATSSIAYCTDMRYGLNGVKWNNFAFNSPYNVLASGTDYYVRILRAIPFRATPYPIVWGTQPGPPVSFPYNSYKCQNNVWSEDTLDAHSIYVKVNSHVISGAWSYQLNYCDFGGVSFTALAQMDIFEIRK